jgi:hypothetical protein
MGIEGVKFITKSVESREKGSVWIDLILLSKKLLDLKI